MIRHTGGCHCRRVTFEFCTPSTAVDVWRCNCSICTMKRNHHIVVPATRFRLLSGEEDLTTYTFNTHQAQHRFCRVCGVQAFYTPRSNPDGYGITYNCVNPGTITEARFRTFDGQNWEKTVETSQIVQQSKL
eukprot:NODE_6240_length_591_cov_19.623616_g5830_i0.p1 GENE.NODE_6240_length_591_cov_19.623616_g5830_i0~~NODE_6240_length_591_cov_19.623616_g5830_i0.p1  ORF type:complete len:132 (-),score=18.16 NODE_6240_length_591_cov_19.623616_g5830_i0:79-474(-)